MFEKKPGKIFAIARVPRKSNVVEIRPSPLSGEFGRDGPEVGARNPSHVRIGTSDDAECLRPYAESVTLRRMVKLNSRKRARRKSSSRAVDARPSELGALLADLRTAKGLSLRQVEEATDRAVSNAYLSQLENGKIQKPSPNVLHSLA